MAATGNPLEEILASDVDEKHLIALAGSLAAPASSPPPATLPASSSGPSDPPWRGNGGAGDHQHIGNAQQLQQQGHLGSGGPMGGPSPHGGLASTLGGGGLSTQNHAIATTPNHAISPRPILNTSLKSATSGMNYTAINNAMFANANFQNLQQQQTTMANTISMLKAISVTTNNGVAFAPVSGVNNFIGLTTHVNSNTALSVNNMLTNSSDLGARPPSAGGAAGVGEQNSSIVNHLRSIGNAVSNAAAQQSPLLNRLQASSSVASSAPARLIPPASGVAGALQAGPQRLIATSSNFITMTSSAEALRGIMRPTNMTQLAPQRGLLPPGGIVFQRPNAVRLQGIQPGLQLQQPNVSGGAVAPNLMRLVSSPVMSGAGPNVRPLAPRLVMSVGGLGGAAMGGQGGIRLQPSPQQPQQQQRLQGIRPQGSLAQQQPSQHQQPLQQQPQFALQHNIQLPAGMVMVKNDQGQFMFVPQTHVQGAGGGVGGIRLQPLRPAISGSGAPAQSTSLAVVSGVTAQPQFIQPALRLPISAAGRLPLPQLPATGNLARPVAGAQMMQIPLGQAAGNLQQRPVTGLPATGLALPVTGSSGVSGAGVQLSPVMQRPALSTGGLANNTTRPGFSSAPAARGVAVTMPSVSSSTLTSMPPPAQAAPMSAMVARLAQQGGGAGGSGGSTSDDDMSDITAGMSAATAQANRDILDNVKKCKNFLSTLLKLAASQPASTVSNVQQLIQGLIDGTVEPEAFTARLQNELNSSPQPYLVPFLKKSLPLLRHSLSAGRMRIDGVRPPQPGSPAALHAATVSIATVIGALSKSHAAAVAQAGAGGALGTHGSSGQVLTNRASPLMPYLRPGTGGAPLTHQQIVQVAQAQQMHMLQQRLKLGAQLRPLQASGSTAAPAPTLPPRPQTPGASTRLAGVAVGGLSGAGGGVTTAGASTPHRAEKRKYEALRDDDDINDVATMGGVNLSEESNNILATHSGLVSAQLRSCKDERFLDSAPLLARINAIAARRGLQSVSVDVAHLVSHAVQARLRTIIEKLSIIGEHRLEMYKNDPRFEPTTEVKVQVKFLEELDSLERKRHEEVERNVLLRAAKSRSKLEDPEQAKLKEKAKAMQALEMEELRQRDANLTALAAIGTRRLRRPDAGTSSAAAEASGFGGEGSGLAGQSTVSLRARTKRITLRDLVFLLEQERATSRSTLLYRAMLK